ncbi:hypothetical protein BDFB_013981, partial [Asbolus verrucosus]
PSIRKKIEQVIPVDNKIVIRTVQSVTLEDTKSLNKLFDLDFIELSEETVDLFLQFLADSGYFNMSPVEELKQEIDKKDNEAEKETEDENEEEYPAQTYSILRVPNFEIKQHLIEACYGEALNIVIKYHLRPMDIRTHVNALRSVLVHTNERNILFTLTYNSRYFVPHSEMQIKKTKKGSGIAPTLDMIIYASLVLNMVKKNVSIKYEVGDQGENISASSDM